MRTIELLLKLQDLEWAVKSPSAAEKKKIDALRKQIPPPILGHYDRLMQRGRKGIALVRHGVCTGCRMRLASGLYAQVLRGEEICLCENCARYLFLAPEERQAMEEAKAQSAEAKPKAAKKRGRPRKTEAS